MKQVKNWLDELVQVACMKVGHKQDHRFSPWAKHVKGVNRNLSTGYAFEDKFMREGTTELEIEPSVFLVCTSSGSARYQVKYYSVILMDANGCLEATDIQADGKTRGWALRIRDQVAELLASLERPRPSSREQFLATLRERFPGLADSEIVIAALNVYELHTRQ